MTPTNLAASCLLIVLVSIADDALAGNVLCINADNVINELYIDGVDVSSNLTNRAIRRLCDCIPLPDGTQTIALRATNLRGVAGLQACRSVHETVYRDWRCVSTKKVGGTSWFGTNYTTMQPWKPAKTYTFKKKRSCKQWRNLPCQTKNREWFWAVRQIPDIKCRIDFCSPSCSGCQSAGAGRCDPDKCNLGAGTEGGAVVLDNGGFVTCQRKCRVEMKATRRTETPDGYIRVTDVETGVVDNWDAKLAGRYLATIDMETCTTTRRSYSDFETAGLRTTDTLNVWTSSTFSPELRRMFGVDVSIGDGRDSYAPWIDIWELGVDAIYSKYGWDSGSTSMNVTMTGINNHDVVFNDYSMAYA